MVDEVPSGSKSGRESLGLMGSDLGVTTKARKRRSESYTGAFKGILVGDLKFEFNRTIRPLAK